MQEQSPNGAKLTLIELNRYFDDLKAWLDSARTIQTLHRQAFERQLNIQGPLRENGNTIR